MSTFAPEVTTTVRDWRRAHPGWGPLTLRVELEGRPSTTKLPSRATIARYLKQEKLARPYERHQDLPDPTRRRLRRKRHIKSGRWMPKAM